MDVPVLRQALEVLVRISQSEIERQRMKEQQRIDRHAATLTAAFRRAEEKARVAEEALGKARAAQQAAEEKARDAEEKARAAEGAIRIGRIQAFQQLLGLPETSRADLGQLPEERLVQLEDSLKRQLGAPRPANGTPPAGPP
jgi:hypothetical protein